MATPSSWRCLAGRLSSSSTRGESPSCGWIRRASIRTTLTRPCWACQSMSRGAHVCSCWTGPRTQRGCGASWRTDLLLCRPRRLAERHRGAAAWGADARAQGAGGVPRARSASASFALFSSAPYTTQTIHVADQDAGRVEICHTAAWPHPPRGERGGAQLLRAARSLLPRPRPRAAAGRDRSGVRRHRAVRCSGAQPARLERSRAEQRPQRRQREREPSRCEWQRWGRLERPATVDLLHRALLLPRHARHDSARRVEAAGAGGRRRVLLASGRVDLLDLRLDFATQ